MRKIAINISLLLGSLAFAFVLGEILCRIFLPSLGWRSFRDVGLGWSSKEYQNFNPLVKADGDGPRILFLGDSYLAGAGVHSDLERFPVKARWKIANADVAILATGGWGTDQQFLAFVQKGRAWQPDVVVVAFCANNDLANVLSNVHTNGNVKPYFVASDGAPLQLFDGYGNPLGETPATTSARSPRQSYLFDLIRFVIAGGGQKDSAHADMSAVDARYRQFASSDEVLGEVHALGDSLSWSPQDGVNRVTGYIAEDHELNTYAWRLTGEILGSLKAVAETAGAELVVMAMPVTLRAQDRRFIVGNDFSHVFATPRGDFTFSSAEPRDRLRDICLQRAIHFFDPTADFIAAVESDRALVAAWPDPGDRHFYAFGHNILAELTADYLNNLLQAR